MVDTYGTTYVRAHTRFLAGVLDPKDKRSENLLDPRSRSRSRYEHLLDPKDAKTSWFQRYLQKPFWIQKTRRRRRRRMTHPTHPIPMLPSSSGLMVDCEEYELMSWLS